VALPFSTPGYREFIRAKAAGVNINNLRHNDIEEIAIPLPPLPEQHRIVAAIETQLTRLDAGVAALKRARANLRRYKAAVLAAACAGRLVPQDTSDEPADALLRRILDERCAKWEAEQIVKMRAQGRMILDDGWRAKYQQPQEPDTAGLPELPQGWVYTLLEPLLSSNRKGMRTGPFGTLLKKHEHREKGIPVLGIENIDSMRFVPGSKIHITREKADELAGYDIEPCDVLISRSGTVGEICVVPENIGEARFSTNIMRVVLDTKAIDADFFSILFNGSPFILDQVTELCKGTTRAFLNQTILSTIVFPLPPLAEQRRIVAEVERRLSVVAEIEAAVAANLKRAARLRQAILKRAFAGRLVPQDPTDEPASALLARIRENHPGGTRPRTKNRNVRQMRMDGM